MSFFHPDSFEYIRYQMRDEKIVVLPTDTIPGFSADPRSKKAVERISAIKNRDVNSPYILLVGNILQAKFLCTFSKIAEDIANKYWPGPLTLLLPRKHNVLPHYFPDSPELALRIPDYLILQKFVEYYGSPIVSTSVNISGSEPLLSSTEIRNAFGKEKIFIPDFSFVTQPCPSTLIRIVGSEIQVLRKGVLQNISK